MSAPQSIRFSTDAMPKNSRFDFFMSTLQQSLWQVTGWSDMPDEFSVDMQGSPLGCLTVVSERICAHHSHRTPADVERSAERSYHLFVATGEPWAFTHRGRHERLERGDVVIIGEGEHQTHAPKGFEGVILKCPEHWIQTWVAEPELITGHRIPVESTWGRVLSPTLRQLSPDAAAAPSLPASVVVDHVGAVLAMIAGEANVQESPRFLRTVRDGIRQRCAEHGLAARDIAQRLGVPTRRLHQVLATAKTSFAAELLDARVELALSQLRQARDGELSPDELARRSGFGQAASLERALRRRGCGSLTELGGSDLGRS